ncbi:MAG: zinc-dependent metalloprotease [Propionibacteriaceae bacterium]|nr:zinc-dependent metalloprotease [Propionibacteriaceae bacterium]
MSEIIDWDVAARVGCALLRPGPKLSASERAAAVTRLRVAAGRAAELVAEASRLPAAEAATHGTTLVVDRAGVVRANAAAMSTVLADLSDDDASRLKAQFQAAGAKLTGTGAGLVMAVIGSAILGQYEPFSDRLLLSAPTIETVRADIAASPDDFALWVCLHEQTHRHQFAAAPWMRDYMRELVRSAVARDDDTPEGDETPIDGLGVVGVVADERLKAMIGKVTAMMSLLEGYADMLMDTSGAAVIPSLPSIRTQVDQRRRVKKYDLASLLRRAFGFDAKIDQYVIGKSFCLTISQKVGMDGLNVAFTCRDTLPTVDELHHPDKWLARCLPDASAA